MNTTKGNELIAEFMGYVFKEGGHYIQNSNSSGEYYDFWVVEECWWDAGYALENGLDFDRSYDSLMKVVEKVLQLDTVHIKIDTICGSYKTNISMRLGSAMYTSESGWPKESMKESIFSALVEFLTWYNKNKK